MVNIKKTAEQILYDGLYNTLLFEIRERLSTKNISIDMIATLLKEDPSFIQEYKEINRHSELSSVQVKKLIIKNEDSSEIKEFKKEINEKVQILKNLENFEVDSKNSAYSIWIGSLGVMVLFTAHNLIALFTELYTTHTFLVYSLYTVILGITYYGYAKMKKNHDNQHELYKKVYSSAKEMIERGLNDSCFSYDEIYEK